jgi:hypothetical protein
MARVTRVEGRYKRERLKELGVEDPYLLVDQLPGRTRRSTGCATPSQLTTPTEAGRSAPFWQAIQQADSFGNGTPAVRERSRACLVIHVRTSALVIGYCVMSFSYDCFAPMECQLWSVNCGVSTHECSRYLTGGRRQVTITAMGRRSRQMCRANAYGFLDKTPKATSIVAVMWTGDLAGTVVPPPSSKARTCIGRLAVRTAGDCNITTCAGAVQGIHTRCCRPLHRADGYTYQKGKPALPPHG